MKLNIQKEIEPFKKELSRVEKEFDDKTKKKTDLNFLTSSLFSLKMIENKVKEKKESITKPINQALKNIRELFSPIEKRIEELEEGLKKEIIEHQEVIMKKINSKKEEIALQVEKGLITYNEAVRKIEKLSNPLEEIKSDEGKIVIRTLKTVVVVDETLLPREYLVPDMNKIREAVLAGVDVPGVQIKEQKIVAINLK